MAQVSSNPVDMKRAFQRHSFSFKLAELPRRPRLVSLFYAAECGLKYLVMMTQSITNTDDLKNSLVGVLGIPKKDIDLHNVEQLCLAASLLPVDIGFAPASFHLNGSPFLPYKIHEAARYGVKISEIYLTAIEEWLENIVTAVEARIATQGI